MAGKRKYSLDETVFENIDTEEKAYWLGFILADGNIYINENRYQRLLQIGLSIKDFDHLNKLRIFLNTDIPIKTTQDKYGNKSCMLQICSRKITNDLQKLGINPRKSKSEVFIELNNKILQKHLIRGIWDGDGSVSFGAVDKKYPKNVVPYISLSGSYSLLESVDDFFSCNLNTPKTKIQENNSIFGLHKKSSTAKVIVEHLYKDSKIFLDRKFKIAKNILNWKPKYNRKKIKELNTYGI